MKTLLLVPLSLLLKFSFCQSVINIKISPENGIGGRVSDIFKSIKYIPLETTKESLFGKIEQLEVTTNYFIILDRQTNSILIFDKMGKFHAKIYGGNDDLNIDNSINNFAVNRKRKTISIIYAHKQTTNIVYYNFDGVLLKKVKQNNLHPRQFYIFPNDEICYINYYTNDKYKDAVVNEIAIYDSLDQFIKGFLPYHRRSATLKSEEIIYSDIFPLHRKDIYDSSLFFVRPYDYNIYSLSTDSLSTSFHFIFPKKYSLPNDYRDNPIYNEKRDKYYKEYKNMIYNISHTYQLGSNLFFSLDTWGGLFGADSYLYSLKSKTLFCINKFIPDQLTYFLPILGISSFTERHFIYSDGINLYSSINSYTLFQAKEATKNKHPNYSPALQHYFATQSRKSNPVIVQLKPNENL